ncbi:MAG TPA: hypothetical protein PLV92_07700 [Pirellulaceae bacterium]|nr:hypothetical protein [Pirellulaceae bacterium]
MPIEFRCNGCQKLLRTPDESAGKKARCPDCGAIVDVPLTSGGAADSGSAANSLGGALPSGGGSGLAGGGVGFGVPAPQQGASTSQGQPADGGGFSNPFSDGGRGGTSGGGGWSAGGNDNPYAAPQASYTAPGAAQAVRGELVHTRVRLDELLSTTWEIFKPQWKMGIALFLVMAAMGAASSLVTSPLNAAAQATREVAVIIVAQIIVQLVGIAAQSWIQLGAINVSLHWARTGEVDIGRIFTIGPKYLRGLVVGLLVQLISVVIFGVTLSPFLYLLATKAPQESALIAAIAGAVVAAPLVIYFTFRFYLSFALIVDRDMAAMEAMRESGRYMTGNKGSVFLAGLVVGFASLVGILACCVGLFAGAAYGTLMSGVAYLMITGQPRFEPLPTPR